MNRIAVLEVLLLVIVSNVTLFLPQMFNYPFSEIPDFYAHLGLADSIVKTGHINAQHTSSYLNFPSLFILIAQLSFASGGGLLFAGAIVPAILATLYPICVYIIIKTLVGNRKIVFLASFIAIVTNVAATNIIFAAPGYLNWMLILIAEFLTWKILITKHNVSRKNLALLLIVSIAIALGDPIYSIGYILALLFLPPIFFVKYRTLKPLKNLFYIILVSCSPSIMYYLFFTKFIIFEIAKMIEPFLRNSISNFFFSSQLPSGVVPVNGFSNQWLSLAFLTSRIVYFFIGVSGIGTIFYLLSWKKSDKSKEHRSLPAAIALSAIFSGAISFGIGHGDTSLAGRFLQFSYLYLSVFSVVFIAFWVNKIGKLEFKYKPKLSTFKKVLIFAIMIILFFAYLPIHFNIASVGKSVFYSSKFYSTEGINVYTPIYYPPVMGVVSFFTGYNWLSEPPLYYNNIPLNITIASSTNNYNDVNVVYNNGYNIMEAPP